jgi:outer membrane receptor for ferrienterochelin and colicin
MTVTGDKMVFSPDKVAGAASGDAAHLLQAVPLVDVDKDGNLSLRGLAATLLIDGKPSPYSDVATALEMIQASSIDRVEVIPHPSARYDASGQGGIINIVLKKNTATGVHGMLNLDAGSRPDNHAGTDLGYQSKKFRLYGNINEHTRAVTGLQTGTQTFLQAGTPYTLSQTARTLLKDHDLDARIGIDVPVDGRTTLSLVQGLAIHRTDKSTDGAVDSMANAKNRYTWANDTSVIHTDNITYNTTASLAHQFRNAGERLDVSLAYALNHTSVAQTIDNNGSPNTQLENSHGHQSTSFWTAQADYTLPIGSHRLDAGYKGEYRYGPDMLDAYAGDGATSPLPYSPSLSFQNHEASAVHALYAIGSGQVKTLHYSAGLRVEYAEETGRSVLPAGYIHRHFLNWFPSLQLSRMLDPGQTLSLSFTSRIERPAMMQLIPYLDNTDPLNYRVGNPRLSPALTQNVELNYARNFPQSGNFLSLSVFAGRTVNPIEPLTSVDTAGITVTQPENTGVATLVGSDLIYRLRVTSVVHLTATVSGNYTHLSQQNGYWNAGFKLTGEAALPAALTLLARGEVNTPTAIPQGTVSDIKGFDLELRRLFFRGHLTVAVIVADFLNQREQSSRIVTAAFIQQQQTKEDSRMLHVHLGYRF